MIDSQLPVSDFPFPFYRIFLEKSSVLDDEYTLITSDTHPTLQMRYKEMEEQLHDQLQGLEKWLEYRKGYIERMFDDAVERAETNEVVGFCGLLTDG